MTPDVESRLDAMRRTLAASPLGVVAGEVRGPWSGETCLADGWPEYRAFLEACDGGRFGSVDLWSASELAGKQFLGADLPGERADWIVVGQLLYEVLALDARGQVVVARRDGPHESLGGLDDFLIRLLGEGYSTLVEGGEQDEWWDVLGDAGLR